jgi:hypothetical protein
MFSFSPFRKDMRPIIFYYHKNVSVIVNALVYARNAYHSITAKYFTDVPTTLLLTTY